ncbi:MAG: T9SS type A sorting domain-containing protein [Crocinitomicaceae bacterium]
MKFLYILIATFFSLNYCGIAFTQCVTTVAKSGGSFSNNSSVGAVAWSSTSNVSSDDNIEATASALVLGDVSNYLLVQDFGFSIPSYATICGISATISKKGTGVLQSVEDFSIRLYSSDAFIGDNKAGSGNWPGSEISQTHGSSSDMWGTTLTYSEINSASFGIGIAVTLEGSIALPTAEIDVIQLSISYDPTLPIELIDFYAQDELNRMVALNWSTASETNNDFFIVEESMDGINWTQVLEEDGIHNATTQTNYSVQIKRSSPDEMYYRLSQVDFDGTREILETTHLRALELPQTLVYPNPSKGVCTIASNKAIHSYRIVDVNGQTLKEEFYEEAVLNVITNVESAGLYFIQLTYESGQTERIKYVVQ